jgi:hypothetical protein
MTADERSTDQTVVKTYVPAYQRDVWDDHAEELGMSRSEFVRTMVQAGRRGFTGQTGEGTADEPGGGPDEQADDGDDGTAESRDGSETRPEPADLEAAVLATLSADEFLSWEDLREAVTDDIEARLEEALQSLQARDRIRYSGRNGGYTLEG